MSLKFTTEKVDQVAVAHLSGRLIETSQADEFQDWLENEMEAHQLNFVFNLESMDYVNSTGINLFIRIFTKIRNKGGDLVFCNVPEKINELLVITKLNTVFHLSVSQEEAVKEFK